MSTAVSELVVYVELDGAPVRAGLAYFTHGRQRVSTSFAYDPAYLADSRSVDLEPGLPRQSGQQYTGGLPGCFQDSSPDRWGRNLIDKRRRALQQAAASRLPATTTVDYLIGVSDLTRQGDLRFAGADGGPFLDPGQTVPKLVSLPRLLAAADQVASDGDDLAAVKELLDAGSGSLGGARPKASVRAEGGGLLTAVGRRSVLLLDRFDRGPAGRRVGYLSAMSLLGARDGDERDYLDIAEALPEHGARVRADLAELFRRVVFSVAVHNTDDHLRNHGFLRVPGGWRLSPVFDVNPDPEPGSTRVTGIAGTVAAEDEPEALPHLARECRLRDEEASAVISQVLHAVGGWRETATRNGIDAAEQARFADVLDGGLAALAPLTS